MALKSQSKKSARSAGVGKVGVLMGGPSSEREISLKSGNAVFEHLKELSVEVVPIDITTDNTQETRNLLKSHNLDCAFLSLHGRFGEDGQIQEILDMMRIPYTGSGKSASQLAMDKVSSRRILEVYGVAVPKYKVVDTCSYSSAWATVSSFCFPVVVKPASNGSSIGLSVVKAKESLDDAVRLAFGFDTHVLIEEFIQGRELTVGILENKALPPIEIVPKNKIFDYEAKYQAGMTEYKVPAELSAKEAQSVQAAALKTHKLLGCYGYSRVDIILSEKGVPIVLEVNTIPGFTSTSLFPKAARVSGLEFGQLCLELIRLAYEKK